MANEIQAHAPDTCDVLETARAADVLRTCAAALDALAADSPKYEPGMLRRKARTLRHEAAKILLSMTLALGGCAGHVEPTEPEPTIPTAQWSAADHLLSAYHPAGIESVTMWWSPGAPISAPVVLDGAPNFVGIVVGTVDEPIGGSRIRVEKIKGSPERLTVLVDGAEEPVRIVLNRDELERVGDGVWTSEGAK